MYSSFNRIRDKAERWGNGVINSSDDGGDDSASSSSRDDNDNSSYESTDVESSRPLVPVRGAAGSVSSLRRRGAPQYPSATVSLPRAKDRDDDKSRRRPRWRRILPPVSHQRLPVWCSCFASFVLSVSFALWMGTLLLGGSSKGNPPHHDTLTVRERTQIRVRDKASTGKKPSVGGGFIQDVQDGFWSIVAKGKYGRKKKHKSVEQLRPGCERADWQSFSFLNCNAVHEVDMESIRGRQMAGEEGIGVLSHGFWRAVWAVDPGLEVLGLKVLKSEHDVDTRNFDRHRRDALTMERLTSSPNIVDIYGFCGNSVLNEFISKTLNDVTDGKSGEGGDAGDGEADEAIYPTRTTPKGRFRLALDVARGLQAIHDINGGPIVHADLTSKQFLVTSDGTVKLNDFNRCRFMATNNATGLPCPFRIPQAPGKHRSPEEYKELELDSKLDMYSGANILYSIITGEAAWSSWSTMETKKMVKDGVIPFIPDKFRKAGTSDAVLANLTELAYRMEPRDRISAAELVAALEGLLADQQASSASASMQ